MANLPGHRPLNIQLTEELHQQIDDAATGLRRSLGERYTKSSLVREAIEEALPRWQRRIDKAKTKEELAKSEMAEAVA